MPDKNMSVLFRSDHFDDGMFGIGNELYAMASGMLPDSKQLRMHCSVSFIVFEIHITSGAWIRLSSALQGKAVCSKNED